MSKQLYTDKKIAFMGKTGIGKSSLINTVFGLELPTNTVEECTKNVVGTWIRNEEQLFGLCDSVMVMDTPGISAALDNDTYYMPFYHHAIEIADCIVWVAQGNTRSDRADQEMLLKLKPYIKSTTKLILCINMVDKIGENYKNDWSNESNAPNQKMQALIEERSLDFQSKMKEVGIVPNAIVKCSAFKNYNMAGLLNAIRENI